MTASVPSLSAAAGRPRRPRPGIRRTLVAWLIVPLALLVPSTAYLFYRLALTPALDSLDHALDGTALSLQRLVVVRDGRPTLGIPPEVDAALRADRYDEVHWVALAPDGHVLGGEPALAALKGPSRPVDWDFFDARYRGSAVRVALHAWPCGTGRCVARVSETLAKRRGVKRQVLASAATAMLVEALVLALLGWVAIARSLRPVRRLSQDIEQRSPEQLGPVDRPDIPHEVAPLVAALNGLFARVTAAAAAEKAFLADAAHQLRTPLTALRTETELALLEPHPPQHEGLLRRLHQGTTRAARLANQLLSQARTEHELKNAAPERIDLKQIATEAAEDWVVRSVEAGVDLGFELESAAVEGHGFLLREMLANLLDNALLYAGSGARVTVRTGLRQDAAGRPAAVLEVEDNGTGVPPSDLPHLFERFYRSESARVGEVGGAGLGLSIVQAICTAHSGRVTAENLQPHGCRLAVALPRIR